MRKILLLKKLIRTLQALILALQELLKKKKEEKKINEFEKFALAIRRRESSNNYRAVNVYGYLGAYQFGMARLCDLGYTERKAGTTGYSNSAFQWKAGYSKEYFLNHPDFQDRVFKQHCQDLIARIKKLFPDYLGKRIDGVEITLSGLVAGAHLGGIGGVKNFLKGYYDSHDQFGTRISDYIKEFSGYNLENL